MKGEDNKWAYALTATKKDKLYQESGFITMAQKKKCFFDLINDKGKEYYIPIKVLSEEQLGSLTSLAQDFIAKCTKDWLMFLGRHGNSRAGSIPVVRTIKNESLLVPEMEWTEAFRFIRKK